MPLIFGIISIILIFLITKKAVNETAAFIASVLFSSHYLMLKIFQAGYGDNGSINIMCSLLFILFFVETLYAIQSNLRKKAVCFGILTLLSTLLFA
jgi:asparagine N-glycosylation enzyme membrane subunit Stt3